MKSQILKFIKPFVAVALGFAFIFSLSACRNKNGGTSGNNGSGTNGNNSPNPSKQTEITITAGETVLNAVLFDNKTAKDFEKMLPLTVPTRHLAPDFARAFDLPSRIDRYEDEPAGYEYELGNLAYRYDGPSVAIIYEASREQTVVPVVPFGKITDDVSIFKDYGGEITIELKPEKPLPVTFGTSVYRGFTLDNVYHSVDNGDIHYHSYFPEDYNASEKYALYISLPGYEGLYFQGVGSNIRSEDFVFEAQKYNDKMIIIATQLNDWGQTSARQTVALTEFMLANYPIDKGKVFINGYSGGGETLSLVLTINPELFTAALHVASVWDGELEPLVNAETPVYFVIGESDGYYGSSRITATYNRLVSLYREKGLSDEDIKRLAVLDVKPRSYFNGGNQHGGIGRVSRDEQIMGWLFRR